MDKYLFICIIALLFILTFSFGATNYAGWRTGIVVLHRPPGWQEQIEHIRKLPMPKRRRNAIRIMKSSNIASVQKFREQLSKYGVEKDVVIEKGFWLGNGAKIRFLNDNALTKIKQFPCVVDAFEDYDGFRILGSYEVADALDVAWGVDKIAAPTCWALGYNGQNIIVAVLDTGTRYTHNDLSARMWHNDGEIPGNSIDDDGNGYVDDYYGYDTYDGDGDPWDNNAPIYHGTHCSGTVAGDGTGGTQTGVAPGAKIMAVKVMGSDGTGTASALADGIQYAVDNGAHILSLSLGWENPSNTIKNFMRPIMEDVLTAGVVASCAAGNEAGEYNAPQDLNAPADCPSPWRRSGEGSARTAVIAVGATNSTDGIASFSSYGPTHWNTGSYYDYSYPPGLMKPDVCAPGVSIKSTYGANDYTYYISSGTSMATPHVAGALAVLLSKNPALTPEMLDSLLQTTALELGTAGKDSLYGSGRIRLDEAILSAPTPSFPVVAYQTHTIDDPLGNGNGIADPGETINLPVTIGNTGADATAVSATISEWSAYITVLNNLGTYGDIATSENATNTSDPYVLQISPSVPPGYSFDVAMHITADGGYEWDDTFTVTVANYPRQTADVDVGAVTLTITNFGEIGFFDPTSSSPLGSGFTYGGYNYLFGGGLFFGFGYDDVVTGENGSSSELQPITDIQTEMPGTFADKELQCAFVDPNMRVRTDLLAMGWASPPDNDFILLRCITTNLTDSLMTDFYIGLYLDFDINYAGSGVWYDNAQWDGANEWGYMWDSQSPPAHPAYVGLVGITDIDRGSVVENPVYVYPSGMGWEDTVKYNFLSGAFSASAGSSGDDWSLIIADGPISLSPASADTFVYAVVAGDNLSDFSANAEQARTHLLEALETKEMQKSELPSIIKISVHPNPFNSVCEIAAPVGAEIEICDLRGNVVNGKLLSITPHSELKPAVDATGTFIWTPNKSLPSGIYLVRVTTTNGQIASKKMVYVK